MFKEIDKEESIERHKYYIDYKFKDNSKEEAISRFIDFKYSNKLELSENQLNVMTKGKVTIKIGGINE